MKPALTAEEWVHLKQHGSVPHDSGDGFEALLRYGDRHMAAAICLDGQPFGFTRDMVIVLRMIAPWFELQSVKIAGKHLPGTPTTAHVLLAVADRIAALLPPEPGA